MPSQPQLDLTFEPPEAAPPAASPAPSPQRTLLVVDDEEGPRKSLRVVFRNDYEVLTAANGRQAVALARQRRIDTAILDIRMEEMSGIELLAELKALDPAIEVIMLTAYETLETARQALRLGACDYLDKPFDIPTLRGAVARAMERRQVSDDIRVNNRKLAELKTELKNHQMQQEILRTRGQIYASILHDINNPMSIIAGYILLLDQALEKANHLDGADLDGVKAKLGVIGNAVKNCYEIAHRYLQFLRECPAAQALTPVNPVLKIATQLLNVHRSGQNHRIVARFLTPEVQAHIHATDLIQVLVNLGANALQCSPHPHEVEISGQKLLQPLALAQFIDGPQDRFLNREEFRNAAPLLAISVADTGPGMGPDVMGRIFEPYFSTKGPSEGTGLGLAIVLRLVKTAQGAIQVHTCPGQGTTFTIYLRASGN